MTYDEFIKSYDAGEMIIGTGITPGGRRFQIYNYPYPGVMIGCISAKGSRNGLDTAVLTRAEYDIMMEAKSLVTDLKASLPGFEGAFVLDTPQAGVRETRHFKGEYNLNIKDILTQFEFEDTIGHSCHPVDIHPFPKEMEDIPKVDAFYFNIPYRCLVAYGKDNLLLAGRNVASTREAAGCTRPTVPCMITGEAAGTAAAICVKGKIAKVKDIVYDKLRDQLKEQGAVI
jgi:hypothetical protein